MNALVGKEKGIGWWNQKVTTKKQLTPQATPQVTPQLLQLTELENKVFKLIITNPSISRSDMAKELGIGSDTVKEYLQKLKRKRYIERIGGNTNAGKWQLIHEINSNNR